MFSGYYLNVLGHIFGSNAQPAKFLFIEPATSFILYSAIILRKIKVFAIKSASWKTHLRCRFHTTSLASIAANDYCFNEYFCWSKAVRESAKSCSKFQVMSTGEQCLIRIVHSSFSVSAVYNYLTLSFSIKYDNGHEIHICIQCSTILLAPHLHCNGFCS